MPKNAQTIAQLQSSHISSKDMLKISKLGFNSMWTKNFQMYKLDLEKAEEPEMKLPTSIGSYKKQENSRKKKIYFCFIDYTKTFDYVDHNKLWKYLKEMEIPDHFTCLLRNMYDAQETIAELDMEQETSSKLGKEYIISVYCHPVYLTYMWSISCEILGWLKHKLKSRLPGEISVTSDMQMASP